MYQSPPVRIRRPYLVQICSCCFKRIFICSGIFSLLNFVVHCCCKCFAVGLSCLLWFCCCFCWCCCSCCLHVFYSYLMDVMLSICQVASIVHALVTVGRTGTGAIILRRVWSWAATTSVLWNWARVALMRLAAWSGVARGRRTGSAAWAATRTWHRLRFWFGQVTLTVTITVAARENGKNSSVVI